MPITVRQPFDPRGKYVARRSFKCNGHGFGPGDDFPWNRLAINVHKLYRLWDQKFIDVKGGEILLTEEEPRLDITLPEETEETGIISGDEGTGFFYDPEVHTLENPEKGEWWIMRAGEKVLQISRKEWKRLEDKQVAVKVNPDRVVSED